MPHPEIYRINVVLDCAEGQAGVLAAFYSALLGWPVTIPHQNGWAGLTAPDGHVMAFQEVPHYAPPVWPWEAGAPGQMVHLDFMVRDLPAAVDFALGLGARLAEQQFFESSRTLLDPVGHTFCLDTESDH